MATLVLRGLVCVTVAAAVLLQGCKKESATPAAEKALATASTSCRDSTTAPDPNNPELDCAAPPTTFDVSSFFGSTPTNPAQAGPTFDSWAWASFAAMNWPAEAAAGQPTGYLRGIPDLDASFTNAGNTDVLVWETFKEKREVFNDTVTASGWQQLTYSASQSIGTQGGIPACTPQDQTRAQALPGGAHRRVLQTGKLSPTLATGPNTLDETAEVASPAQESQNALCAGYQGTPAYATCQQLFPPPPGGTADTPYPPTIVNNRPSLGVGPRVFDPGLQNDMQNPDAHIIFYEVRVNYDYFNYVLTNGLNVVNAVSPPPPPPAPAATPPYALPWRTSAQGPPDGNPQKSQLTLSPVNYNAQQTVTTYQSGPATPPPVGSIQVKSAWKFLAAPDPAYHTTEAVYFQTTAQGTPCYAVATFGLIGLHIIQRAHMGNSSMANADPVGGTFIFATWEHNTIANGGGYSYVNFLADNEADQDNPTPYPPVANAIAVTRQQPYPLATTNAVN
ncbi:MAG TPA: hypothetical protein VNA69_21740 [Thermoanaerobaculia bacterium]|nr:hypothetical protein [Thermoanaerobaculia bacterium]